MTGCFDAFVVPPVSSGSTRRVRELADLACIFESEVQVACLARDAQPAIERELEHAVATGALGSGFSGTHAVEVPSDAIVLPGCVGPALRADIAVLIELYADLVGCPGSVCAWKCSSARCARACTSIGSRCACW